MTDRDSTRIVQLSELLTKMDGKLDRHAQDTRQRLERFGSAVAGMREEIVQLAERLDGHIAHSDLKHLGHRDARGRIVSDVRELKADLGAVEDTSRNMAIDAARAEVMVGHVRHDVVDSRGNRREWLRLLVAALLGAATSFLAALLSGVF